MNKTSGGFPISGFDGDLKCKKPDKMQAINIRYIGNKETNPRAAMQMIDSESFFKLSSFTGKRADVAPIAAITSFFDNKTTPYKINAGLS
jgi:hypothetical protein